MSSHPRRLLATLLCAAAWQPASATAFVEGEALYRERMLPPPGATLIVTLEDVSRADAKATEIASARRLVAGAPPYRWRIGYDAALAAAPRRLALRASIVSADGLWMTTDTFVPLPDPPASAAPSLRLVRVAEPAAAPPGVDCAAASTQAEMAQCAHADFLAASAACSARYAALAAILPAAQRSRLQRTQKAWLGYRTAACRFESGAAQGGSVQSQLNRLCAARMTRERAEALGRLADCAEGDVTCNRPAR